MSRITMQETTTLRGAQLRRAIQSGMEAVYARYRAQGVNFSGVWSGDVYRFSGGPSGSISGTISIQDMRNYSVVTVDAEVPLLAQSAFRSEVQGALVQLPGRGQFPVAEPTTTATTTVPAAQAETATTQAYEEWGPEPAPHQIAAERMRQEAAQAAARAARRETAAGVFGQLGLALQEVFGQNAQQIAYDEAQAVGYPAGMPGQPVTTGYAEGKPGAAAAPGVVPTQEQGFFQSLIDIVKPAPPEGFVAPGGAVAPSTAPPSVPSGEDRPAPPPPREPAGMPGWFWGVLVAAGLVTAIGVTYMLVKTDDED